MTTEAETRPRGFPIIEVVRAMRPHQWVKNLFVLAPLVFGGRLAELDGVGMALLAFVLFSMLSGAVYLLNDIIDRDKDRKHPLKRFRPIASGKLPVRSAAIALVVAVCGAVGGSFAVTLNLGLAAAGYFLLNVAYSLVLKHVVFVDLVCIAGGFILRILAGAAAVGVEVSIWLVLCTFLLALFLGLGKRKHELVVSGDKGVERRRVLASYRHNHLDMALNVTSAITSLVYLLYTMSDRTVRVFGTKNLVFTIPFIVFGLVRYMQILATHRDEESPTDYILKDWPFLANLLLWGVTVTLVIYVF